MNVLLLSILFFSPCRPTSPHPDHTTPLNETLWNLYQAIQEERLFQDLESHIHGRAVNIKVGVLIPERRRGPRFWVEFDPVNKYELKRGSIVLPFMVAAEASPSRAFYHHKLPYCSSMYNMSDGSSDLPSYRLMSEELCRKAHGGFMSFASDVCFECQGTRHIKAVKYYPAVALRSVVRSIPKAIDFMDIDAQGADLELIMSLGPDIQKVRKLQMECQLSTWLYQSPIPNNCTVAEEYLRQRNFTLVRREINNCHCDEWNLIMQQE